MLKLTKIFLVATLLLFMASCSSDDDNADSDGLVGSWNLISFTTDVTSTTIGAGQDINYVVAATGSNFDYQLTFTESNFTTTGNYDVLTSGTYNGTVISETTDSYMDVTGSGTYSTDNTSMTVNGSFFDFDFNGAPVMTTSQEQTVPYEINGDGDLIFSQNETMETISGGITATTIIVSTSKWEKQ